MIEAPPRQSYRELLLPFSRFLKFCRDQMCGWAELGGSSGDENPTGTPIPPDPTPLSEANLVCSRRADSEMHIPILDLDMDAMLVPSSTVGHHHLYIDKQLTWEDYCKLLDVMAEVGILEPGYVEVSKKRKMTQVRTPWTDKF